MFFHSHILTGRLPESLLSENDRCSNLLPPMSEKCGKVPSNSLELNDTTSSSKQKKQQHNDEFLIDS